MEDLECTNCNWFGDITELVSLTDDFNDPCDKCPDCLKSEHIQDFE